MELPAHKAVSKALPRMAVTGKLSGAMVNESVINEQPNKSVISAWYFPGLVTTNTESVVPSFHKK